MVGALLFVHLAAGLTVPYALLRPVSKSPDFLESAAANSSLVRLCVLTLFVGGAVTIGIAIAALPVFRQYGRALSLWLLALAVVNCSLQAVENAGWLSMLSLSQEYARAGAGEAGLFQTLGASVYSAWRWTHYSHLLAVGCWIFVLFALLWRSALVPRALSAFGLVTALMQITGITLPALVGYRSVMPMGMPLGVVYLVLILWLLVKGFDESRGPLPADARAVEPVAA
jgi:hypothetical protein